MHGPVDAAGLAVLPGTVQGVDDPDPLGVEPGGIVPYPLLGEHGVTRPPAGQDGGDEIVRALVPGGAQRVGVRVPPLGAQFAQQLTGALGQPAGEGTIGGGGHQ